MRERMFKKGERDFWLYPKLLLVGLACFALSALLNQWLASSWAVTLGFLPLFAVMAYAGRPLSYRRWLIHIGLVLFLLGVLTALERIVKIVFGS
jgi:hypothetical protein